jgi:RyR domain
MISNKTCLNIDMDRFIKLLADQALEQPVIRGWFNCVSANAPSGVVNSITVQDDEQTRHVVRLVHQTMDHAHAYLVPLTRDLRASEIDEIVNQFAVEQPELNFDVETNQTRLRAKDDAIPLDAAKHLALCIALAKQEHESWLHERTNAGWHYGLEFDAAAKTHPLIRPWDQLPERYKMPDLDWPQKLVSMLNDNGYVVLAREELESLLHVP